MLDTFRALRCVQLDPINAVTRSHRLVLYSRLGPYPEADLDRLLWTERRLFEYWAHCASIVLTEDYPIHQLRMRSYRRPGQSDGGLRRRRLDRWVRENRRLRTLILAQLGRRGPLLSRDLEESGLDPRHWVSTGWTSGSNVSRMLDYLWIAGEIMVVGRRSGQKVWHRADRTLPDWVPRDRLSERQATLRSIEHSIRALGAATEKQIKFHFVRGHYPGFHGVLTALVRTKRLIPIRVSGRTDQWYLDAEDEPLLADLDRVAESSRVTPLSPFDNLIADRPRTQQLFDFDFRIEIYTPPAQRKFGYYVLPLLHGDRLIGRIDPVLDRDRGSLLINAVHAEADASREAGPAVAEAIAELAKWLGAESVKVDRRRTPAIWRRSL